MPWESKQRAHATYVGHGSTIRRRNHAANNSSVAIVFGRAPVAEIVTGDLRLRTKSCPLLTVKPASIHRPQGTIALPSAGMVRSNNVKQSPQPAGNTLSPTRHNLHHSMLPHIPSLPESRPTIPLPRASEHRQNYERRWPHCHRTSQDSKQDVSEQLSYSYSQSTAAPPRPPQSNASSSQSARGSSQSHMFHEHDTAHSSRHGNRSAFPVSGITTLSPGVFYDQCATDGRLKASEEQRPGSRPGSGRSSNTNLVSDGTASSRGYRPNSNREARAQGASSAVTSSPTQNETEFNADPQPFVGSCAWGGASLDEPELLDHSRILFVDGPQLMIGSNYGALYFPGAERQLIERQLQSTLQDKNSTADECPTSPATTPLQDVDGGGGSSDQASKMPEECRVPSPPAAPQDSMRVSPRGTRTGSSSVSDATTKSSRASESWKNDQPLLAEEEAGTSESDGEEDEMEEAIDPVEEDAEGEEEDEEDEEDEDEDEEDDEAEADSANEDDDLSKGTSTDPKAAGKSYRIACNLTDAKYEVIRDTAKALGWKILRAPTTADIIWRDMWMEPSQFKGYKMYQKINHFPQMAELARKTNLGRNLKRMKKLHPKEFDFFPMTYILPGEYDLLMAQKKPKTFYIVKPECGSQGRGIFLTSTLKEVQENREARCVVQVYLSRPLLIDNYKFDLRIYVLITCVDPLSVFIYREGLVRFCTQEYQKPTLKNMEQMYMHLTNYAINKNNEIFEAAEDTDGDSGFKRSLTSVLEQLGNEGWDQKALWQDIEETCVKTILAGQPGLAHMFKAIFRNSTTGFNCFELLGFDIMLDETGRAWMIEVNNLPSFETETGLDAAIKKALMRDTMNIIGGDNPARRWFQKQKLERAQARIYGDSNHVGQLKKEALLKAQEEKNGGFRGKLSPEARQAADRQRLKDAELSRKKSLKEELARERTEMQQTRFKYEDEACGNYFRAFPVKDGRYDDFIQAAPALMADTKSMRLRREEINRQTKARRSANDSQ